MLFAVKNRLLPTLILAALIAGGALAARAALGLSDAAGRPPEAGGAMSRPAPLPFSALLARAGAGLALVLASDMVIHGGLWLLGGAGYRKQYHAFVEYFRPQGAGEIAASGVLAGSEELLFRGVLLAALVHRAGWNPIPAVAVTALLFGAAHLTRHRQLAPFAVWAVWEGVLLGALYLATGSLAALVLLHAAHDVAGFALMARQRRPGQRPAPA